MVGTLSIDVGCIKHYVTGILQTDNSEQVILEPKLIARNYFRSWFFLDLISSLPLDYLFLMFNQVTLRVYDRDLSRTK